MSDPSSFLGTSFGQTAATGGRQRVISGLTVSRFINVGNSTASQGIAYLGDINVTTTTGYPLEPGKSIVVDTSGSRDRWYVTTDGLTARVSYATAAGEL